MWKVSTKNAYEQRTYNTQISHVVTYMFSSTLLVAGSHTVTHATVIIQLYVYVYIPTILL